MKLHRRTKGAERRGYTLLEVLLASAIAVLLMGALYVAVDVQIKHINISRDVVEQTNLTRVLVARMSNDIRSTLPPQLPPTQSASASQGGATGSAGSTGGSSTTTTSGVTTVVVINQGVQGDSTHLVLYLSKGPRELYSSIGGQNSNQELPTVSDLRRVSYWLVGAGDTPQGLAWEERKDLTSDDAANAIPPNIPDEESHIIAEEVKSLQFRYYDGSTWQDSWDSTQPPADNSSTNPQGPPRAIEITLGLAAAGSSDTQSLKYYRHVVPVLTANGAPQTSTTGSSP